MSFDQLSELDITRTDWKVKVRVTRMWPSISNQAVEGRDNLKGYNLILLDDANCHVHAFIYADQWNQIADTIDEGSIYVISNFYTKPPSGSLKPVSSKVLVNFSPSTTVKRVNEEDFMIPLHKFEFVDLGDFFSIASSYPIDDQPEFAVDMIGVIEDYKHLCEITTVYGPRKIVRFRISDGRNHHLVTVWSDLAVKTEASYNELVEKPVIVILASTKLKIYKQSVQISTLPSSKIYLNSDNESVAAMRRRLEEEGYIADRETNGTPPQSNVPRIIETLTLKELNEKSGMQHFEKNFFCNVKVQKVEESIWFYSSCSDCEADVEKVEGKLKCTKCPNKTVPVPETRYRIVILAEDSTEAYNFILTDRAARRLIGMSATKLQSDMLKSGNNSHSKINDINGKELRLKIKLNEENVNSGSRLYYATDAYDADMSISSMSQPSSSIVGSSSFTENNVAEISDCRTTPGTKNSSSKKIKMEK